MTPGLFRRLFITLILTLFLSSLTVAASWDAGGDEISYGDEGTVRIECSGDDCSSEAEIRLCKGEDSFGGTYDAVITQQINPIKFSCSLGSHEMKVYDGDGYHVASATVEVTSRDMEDAHIGKNMIINLETDDKKLKNFQLTDDIWNKEINGQISDNSSKSGHIMLKEPDSSWLGDAQDLAIARFDIKSGEDGIISSDETDFIDYNAFASETNLEDNKVRTSYSASTDSDAAHLFLKSFGSLNSFDYEDVSNWGIDSQSPIHSNGVYNPEGEIALGAKPAYCTDYDSTENSCNSYNDDAGKGPYFFVCRDGAEMSNGYGEQVPQVVQTGDGLYRCDLNKNEWEPVDDCYTGLDEDGDGTIDASDSRYQNINTGLRDNDPGCEDGGAEADTSDPEEPSDPEDSPSTCDQAKVYKDEDTGDLYAYYGIGGDECKRKNYTEWSMVVKDDTEPYGGEPYDPTVYPCSKEDAKTDPSSCPSSSNFGFGEYEHTEMKVVEYRAHPEYFEQLAKAKGKDLTTDGVKTSFVEQHGGWVQQIQGLHTAERKYDPGQTFDNMDETECQTRTLADGTVEDCHSYSWWSDTNMTNLGGYQEDAVDNHKDAWLVANAGAINSEVKSASNPDSERWVFQGGFAGKCPEGQGWRYNSEEGLWRCEGTTVTGTITIGGAGAYCASGCEGVNVPDFGTSGYLPDTKTYTESGEVKKEIGIIQFPYLNKQPVPDHVPGGVYSYSSLSGGSEITEMVAECWAGGIGDRPDDPGSSDRAFAATATPSSSGPWGVAGEVNFEGYSSYACKWGYHTEDLDSDQLLVGEPDNYVIEFHRHQNPGDKYYDFWSDLKQKYDIKEEYGPGELSNQLN